MNDLHPVETQEEKYTVSHHEVQHVDAENADPNGQDKDAALRVLRDGQRIHMTEEQVNGAGCRRRCCGMIY